jgi:hypothetical protein
MCVGIVLMRRMTRSKTFPEVAGATPPYCGSGLDKHMLESSSPRRWRTEDPCKDCSRVDCSSSPRRWRTEDPCKDSSHVDCCSSRHPSGGANAHAGLDCITSAAIAMLLLCVCMPARCLQRHVQIGRLTSRGADQLPPGFERDFTMDL